MGRVVGQRPPYRCMDTQAENPIFSFPAVAKNGGKSGCAGSGVFVVDSFGLPAKVVSRPEALHPTLLSKLSLM